MREKGDKQYCGKRQKDERMRSFFFPCVASQAREGLEAYKKKVGGVRMGGTK